MTSAKALAYFRNDSKTRIVADAGPGGIELFYYNCMEISGGLCLMLRGICQRLSDVTHRREGGTCSCMGLRTVSYLCVWSRV